MAERLFSVMKTASARLSLICLAMAACGTPQTARGAPSSKHALIVSINAYGPTATPDVPAAEQWKALQGTHHDADALGAELKRRGYEVAYLRDAAATRQGIADAFERHLIAPAKAGDRVWFHYSGHGQQVPDDSGAPDEVDGYDEALVPYDNRGIKDGSGHLRDDLLGKLVARATKRTRHVIISLDSCHAGTGTRSDLRDVRGAPPTQPPAVTRGAGTRGFGEGGQGYVVLAAAQPTQYAGEVRLPGGKHMGAFTYLMIRVLRSADETLTFQSLVDRIGAEIAAIATNQDPLVEGDATRRVFGRGAGPAARYFQAHPKGADGQVRVEAGELHGLHVGSVLGIFPFDGDLNPDKPRARLEITRAELTHAFGRPASDTTAGKIFKQGTRAIELLSVVPPNPLRVALEGPAAELRGAFGDTPFVRFVDAHPQVTVALRDGDYRLTREDGAPLLIPNGAQKPLDQGVPASSPDAVDRVRTALEAAFRRQRLLQMSAGAGWTQLDVDLSVHRVDARATSRGVVVQRDHGALPKGGAGTLRPDDVVQFHAHNRSDRDVYVTIVGLNPDGSIGVLYPREGQPPADTLVRAGTRRALELAFARMTPPAGTQLFKLIATESPTDLRRIAFSTGTRGATSTLGQWAGPLMQPGRAVPFGAAPSERWGTDVARLRILGP